MHRREEVQHGTTLFVGSEAEWHEHHVAAVLAAPARDRGVPPPTREQFRLQLELEERCRHLALERNRREYAAVKERGAVEQAPPVRRLLAVWMPQLTERIEKEVARVCELVSSRKRAVSKALQAEAEVRLQQEGCEEDGLQRGAAAVGGLGGEAGAGGTGGHSDGAAKLGEYDDRMAQAALMVRNARRELTDLQILVTLLQPRTALEDVVRDGTSATSRARAARTKQQLQSGTGGTDVLVRRSPMLRRMLQTRDIAARMGDWDAATRLKVGSALLSLMLDTLRVGADGEPAFSHSTSLMPTFKPGFKTPGTIAVHPRVLDQIEGETELLRLMRPSSMPMVVEPRPWEGVRAGGFLTQTTPIMRTQYSPQVRPAAAPDM
ncbi:DNA-directed RNA polymerase, mitochondrial [Tetrabaena socialis]|uniref:DNA-directed RNA polymerase, mitochondrial n=1 Tax=Tetrabaena socialis TaxID=47790 RepID=A0A2J7ZNU9_9CHLO|nr:DNA-directed RNA polymerase, mitochondrial [Tetrabaena socialis]|eukprot:PNH01946.1 DNA-directed RNA polymerase, mitochondrial [Tetrabaena socialis]